jgi:hypothetical protein
MLAGDVTDDLFAGKDASAKRALVDSLNKQAKKKQEAALQQQLCKAAAEILRTRVFVVDSVQNAKAYMESSTQEGMRARVCYIDFTQFAVLQAKGQWSKILGKQPSKEREGYEQHLLLTWTHLSLFAVNAAECVLFKVRVAIESAVHPLNMIGQLDPWLF